MIFILVDKLSKHLGYFLSWVVLYSCFDSVSKMVVILKGVIVDSSKHLQPYQQTFRNKNRIFFKKNTSFVISKETQIFFSLRGGTHCSYSSDIGECQSSLCVGLIADGTAIKNLVRVKCFRTHNNQKLIKSPLLSSKCLWQC